MDYPPIPRGPLLHPGDLMHASDHYSKSKDWLNYQKHGEVVKDPYYAHYHKNTIVALQHEIMVDTPLLEINDDTPVVTKDGWPLVWASGGSIPAFTHLRETKHEWGIKHYPKFQKAVKLGYQIHNFKVYVSDNDYFYSKFTPLEHHDWKNKSILYENNRGTDALPVGVETDIRTVDMDFENDPYFALVCSAYIATFLCGISVKCLEWNDHTPKQITSIARYHLYYTMKKFITNTELMKAYDLSGMKGHLPVSVQSFNGASHGGGTYVKAGRVNHSNSDHLHFIPYDSNGITTIGTRLLMESVESYVSDQLGKSLQTQQAFRIIVGDTVLQTNENTTIQNMRIAIRDTNVVLNMAINPDIILVPSRLIILEKPIPGYDNILSSPTKTTTFGINPKLNYAGVKQSNPPKKQHQNSAPTKHLDTLGEDTAPPKKPVVRTFEPVEPPSIEHQETNDGTLAGLGIGTVVPFLLLRTLL
jgi:hypothetical protein